MKIMSLVNDVMVLIINRSAPDLFYSTGKIDLAWLDLAI